MEIMALLLFVAVCGFLLLGYPVALTLAGTSLMFAGIGVFDRHIRDVLLERTAKSTVWYY